VAVALVAFAVTPFGITGLLRTGLASGVAVLVALAVAIACWFRRARAVAGGIALGTIAWAALVASALRAMDAGPRF
jgi:hypothetical protein